MALSQPSMDGVLDAIADEGCRSLLEEVFLDLEVGACIPHAQGPGLLWRCSVWCRPAVVLRRSCLGVLSNCSGYSGVSCRGKTLHFLAQPGGRPAQVWAWRSRRLDQAQF